METSTAYIGLGANLGNPQITVISAIDALAELPATVFICASSLYLTAPVEADGDDYVNAVAKLQTRLNPFELLIELQKLEHQFFRTRSYQNAPRTLDLDLLLYEQQTIDTADLKIPHPRMSQRAFVIFPLLEIAPGINIPGVGSAQSLLPNLQNQIIQKIAGQSTLPVNAKFDETQLKN